MVDIIKKLNNDSKNTNITALVSSIIFGIVAHSFMFLNKISFFDDTSSIVGFSAVRLFTSARYFQGVLKIINDYLFGTYSNSFLNGIVSLIIIALTNALIIKILNVKKNIYIIIASSIMVLSTGLISMYAYIFTAVFYSIAIFLSVFSTYMFVFYFDNKNFPIKKVFVTAVLLYLSLTIYQSYILFGIIVYLLYALTQLFYNKFSVKYLFYYVISVIFAIILYIITNKLFFAAFNRINNSFVGGYSELQIASYQGISSFDTFGFLSINSILNVFKHIFISDEILFKNNFYIYIMLLVLIIFSSLYVFLTIEYSLAQKIYIIFTDFLLLVVINSLYILEPSTSLYALPLYPKCLIFLLPIVYMQNIRFKPLIKYIMCVLFIYLIMYNIALSNNIYVNRFFRQANEINYCETLAARIQSVEGYSDKYDIYVYGKENSLNTNVYKYDMKFNDKNMMFDSITPYNTSSLNTYNFYWYMEVWTGFKASLFKQNVSGEYDDIVKGMSCYPADGSIKVVDNKILIKFSE